MSGGAVRRLLRTSIESDGCRAEGGQAAPRGLCACARDEIHPSRSRDAGLSLPPANASNRQPQDEAIRHRPTRASSQRRRRRPHLALSASDALRTIELIARAEGTQTSTRPGRASPIRSARRRSSSTPAAWPNSRSRLRTAPELVRLREHVAGLIGSNAHVAGNSRLLHVRLVASSSCEGSLCSPPSSGGGVIARSWRSPSSGRRTWSSHRTQAG
jgi:hypothetical protein